MKYELEKVSRDEIKAGDVIMLANGNLHTLCHKEITKGFMGTCILGDSYCLGQKPVLRANIFQAQ